MKSTNRTAAGGDETTQGRDHLREAGIHPWSVLRTGIGPWRTRRSAWHEMGISSRAGREGVSTWDSSSAFAKASLTTINDGLSTFDPVLAEASYTWYCPDGGRVLDPFAGGSVRGLVAGNLGYDYTGVDLSPRQVAANRGQGRSWRERDMLPGQVEWITRDAAEILPRLPDGRFDYVLTCPPYHNLETYTDLPADLSNMAWDDFTDAYRQIIAQTVRCLAEHRFATWVVGEIRDRRGLIRGLVPLTIDAHRSAGGAPVQRRRSGHRARFAAAEDRLAMASVTKDGPPPSVRPHLSQGRPEEGHGTRTGREHMTRPTDIHCARRCDGRLQPWIDTAGELGWHTVTASRCLATSIAHALRGTMSAGDHGEWWTRIPCSAIPAVAMQADPHEVRYMIGPHGEGAGAGVFTLRSAPWTTAQLTTCPLSDLPAEGQLSVHPVILKTCMGRLIRYLAPTFTPA